MADLQQTWSESYASFDVTEWIENDNDREPSTVAGSQDEETLEVNAMPNEFAQSLHEAADQQHAQEL